MTAALEGWLQPFWAGMGDHLWQSGLFIGLLALIARAMRDAPARVLGALYWIGVLKLVLPLPLLGPLFDRLDLLDDRGAEAAATAWTTVTVFIHPVGRDAGVVPTLHPALALSLSAAWALIVGVVLWRSIRSGRCRNLDRFVGVDGLATTERARLRAALSSGGVGDDQVRITGGGGGPSVRGWFRPVIMLPASVVEGLDADDLTAILVHEREHVRRRDPLRYAGLAVVQAALWFFPPVWWLARRIRETTEMACDEAVLRAGLAAAAYCRSLARAVRLGLAGESAASSTGILGHPVSFLRRRLERIRSGRRFETMASHRIALIAVAAAALVVSLLPVAPPVSAGRSGERVVEDEARLVDEVNIPVALSFKQTDVRKILDTMSRASGVEFQYVGEVGDLRIDIDVRDVRLDEALVRVGAAAGLKFRVVGPRTIEVRPIALAGSPGVTTPALIPQYKINPAYPEAAREEKIEGRVMLQALIDRFGLVSDVELLSSTPEGYRPFVDSAIDAVSQWRYEPATKDGEPVDVYFTVRVDFRLE